MAVLHFFLVNSPSNIYSILYGFERRICAQTQVDLQIFKKFNMSQMNPKEVFHIPAYSVQLLYIAVTPFNKNLKKRGRRLKIIGSSNSVCYMPYL